MADNSIFGFLFRKTKKQIEENKRKSFVQPTPNDGSIVVDGVAGAYASTSFDIIGNLQNDIDLINKYREMELQPEVDSAIDDIVNDAIVIDHNEPPVSINLDRVTNITESTKKAIQKEFATCLQLLDFQNQAYDIFRRWYVDGRINYQVIINDKDPKEGIQELRYIDPRQIKKIVETETLQDPVSRAEITTIVDEYYIYTRRLFQGLNTNNVYGNLPIITASSNSGNITGLKVSKDSIVYCHSGKLDESNTLVLSHLHKAIKAFNQLRMMEDALVIYRLTRAPERRIFYIDTGNLPATKAEEVVKRQMAEYKSKLTYDARTGSVADDRNHLSMVEDFWMARREGSVGTEITTLPGGQNLGEMTDVEYFQKALFRSLNVPVSRLQSENGFNMGKSAEISRDELKFEKFVRRLRQRFSHIFDAILERQLILKNITTADDWKTIKSKVSYEFATDNYFSELKDTEILTERLNVLDRLDGKVGVFFSKKFVQKKVLRMKEDEIEAMEKEMTEERSENENTETSINIGVEQDDTTDF